MTIWTKEAAVPDEFPPARLFLNDIEEIVRILAQEIRPEESSIMPTVTFTIKDQGCDTIQDLPKIAKKTNDLSIVVENAGFSVPAAMLSFDDQYGSRLSYYCHDEVGPLRLHNKLAPIFKRRKLPLRALMWSSYWALWGVLSFSLLLATTTVVILIFKGILHPVRTAVIALILLPTIWTLAATLRYHSVIIMRNSSEPSELRQGLPQKIILLGVGSIVTLALSALGSWLKHKYWP